MMANLVFLNLLSNTRINHGWYVVTCGGPICEAAKLFLNVMPTFTATELVEFKDLPEGKVWMARHQAPARA